tara:strand:- start:69261 stop:69806 length:546 start_codon:yes stop_codon:yes gene_type:complete
MPKKKKCQESFHHAVHEFRDALLEDDPKKRLKAPEILKRAKELTQEAQDHLEEPDAEHLADLLYVLGGDPELGIPLATEKKLSKMASDLYEKVIIDETSKPWRSLRGTDGAKVTKSIMRAIEDCPKKRGRLIKLIHNLAQYSDEHVAHHVIEHLYELGMVESKPPLVGKSPLEALKAGKKI